eukprot:Pgem_evm1s19969
MSHLFIKHPTLLEELKLYAPDYLIENLIEEMESYNSLSDDEMKKVSNEPTLSRQLCSWIYSTGKRKHERDEDEDEDEDEHDDDDDDDDDEDDDNQKDDDDNQKDDDDVIEIDPPLSRQLCSWIYSKGKRKHERCHRKVVNNNNLCNTHKYDQEVRHRSPTPKATTPLKGPVTIKFTAPKPNPKPTSAKKEIKKKEIKNLYKQLKNQQEFIDDLMKNYE